MKKNIIYIGIICSTICNYALHAADASQDRIRELNQRFLELSNCTMSFERHIKYLIEQGADINTQDENGNTLLHRVMQHSYSEHPIRVLLEYGADINIQNNDGNTPLHYAARRSSSSPFIEYLLTQGADPKIENNDGITPLGVLLAAHKYPNAKTVLQYGSRYDTGRNRIYSTDEIEALIEQYNPHLGTIDEYETNPPLQKMEFYD